VAAVICVVHTLNDPVVVLFLSSQLLRLFADPTPGLSNVDIRPSIASGAYHRRLTSSVFCSGIYLRTILVDSLELSPANVYLRNRRASFRQAFLNSWYLT